MAAELIKLESKKPQQTKEQMVAELVDFDMEVNLSLSWIREILADGWVGYRNMTNIDLNGHMARMQGSDVVTNEVNTKNLSKEMA